MREEGGHSDEEGQLRGAPEQTNLKLALIQIQQQKQLNQPQCAEFACTASWCQPWPWSRPRCCRRPGWWDKTNELSKHFNASLEHPVLCRLGWGHVARQRPGGDLRSQPSSLSGVQHVALLETAVVGHWRGNWHVNDTTPEQKILSVAKHAATL